MKPSNNPHAELPFGNPQHPSDVYTAHVDGAARGNPGPASYAVIVRGPNGAIEWQNGKYIGRMTNNVAEYYGLIAALDYATDQKIARLRVISDSELMVKQMQGKYKVKSPDLQPLHERARKLARGLAFFAIEHVRRERNSEADALANEALDRTSSSSFSASSGSAVGAASRLPSASSSIGASSVSAPSSLPASTSAGSAARAASRSPSASSSIGASSISAPPNLPSTSADSTVRAASRSAASSSHPASGSAAASSRPSSGSGVAASSGPAAASSRASSRAASADAAASSSPLIAMTPHMRAVSADRETPREQRVKARYADGALHPLEPIDIAEGETVEIRIRRK